MSAYCQKCGAENIDNAKFCKSCGAALYFEAEQKNGTENRTSKSSTMQTVKKVLLWIVVLISLISAFVLFYSIQEQKKWEAKLEKEKVEAEELRIKCANNDGEACYKVSKMPPYEERSDALAKGCRLGNKDACREGQYYKEGCNLQDGESCYMIASQLMQDADSYRSFCDTFPEGDFCQIYKKAARKAKQYNEKACQYGYSQGCMETK